jgi:hypothetical protein
VRKVGKNKERRKDGKKEEKKRTSNTPLADLDEVGVERDRVDAVDELLEGHLLRHHDRRADRVQRLVEFT